MQLSFDTQAAAPHPLSWMQGLLNDGLPAASSVPALPVVMRRGETLVVDHPQAVVCTEGTLWITHDSDPVDHVVERGGRHAGTGPRMLVHAMSDARVEFIAL
jgi:Protein of unknown function (DUF2917)